MPQTEPRTRPIELLPTSTAVTWRRAIRPAPAGAVVKRLLLGFWATYFSIVALTNAVDLLGHLGALHWTFLDSGNFDYMHGIVKVYEVGSLPTGLLMTGALAIELVGAALFWRALVRRRDGAPALALYAVSWSILVWSAFTFMTELFIAYQAESVFRELLMLAIGTALVLALVPDDAGEAAR